MAVKLQTLMDRLPQVGEVRWISVRPNSDTPAKVLEKVEADAERGLVGDHYSGRTGKRHVTLIQWEHLAAVASMLGRDHIDPALLRRNIAVAGINLLALKDKRFEVGAATVEFTGLCHPCSFMEETLGPGGYNAMRGHGGITGRIVRGGLIAAGDRVAMVPGPR